jgi:hypothetical protein
VTTVIPNYFRQIAIWVQLLIPFRSTIVTGGSLMLRISNQFADIVLYAPLGERQMNSHPVTSLRKLCCRQHNIKRTNLIQSSDNGLRNKRFTELMCYRPTQTDRMAATG